MDKKIIRMKDCLKEYTYDQDKACSPEDTVKRFHDRLEEQQLDVLKEVKRIDNGRLDIPVYFSVCGKDALETIGTKKQMGKGSTPEQSRASACMELAERFSFFSFMKNPDNFIHDTYAGVKAAGHPVLPLERWLASVHDENTSVETLEQLIADVPLQWVWANNLTRNEATLMPFSWFYGINEFNGPSAGNTYEEAISQGVAEIVERHVCAVVSYEHKNTPSIDHDSITDPVARELLEKFTRHGIQVYLNDFTLNTGIPTVAALCVDPSTFPEKSEIVYTAGTTPNPTKALIRALTEVAQLAGDFNSEANYVASGLPKPLSLDEVPYITNPGMSIRLDELPDLNDNNIKVENERCLAALRKLDLDVFVVDVDHPTLQIPAIYTIIPGCHFRERSRISNVGLFAAKLVSERVEDPEVCIQQLQRMEKILPEAYYLEFYLGQKLISLGKLEEALEHLEHSLTMQPEEEDIPYIYSYLGDTLKTLGRYDEAIRAIEKGRAFDDERPDFHNILGVCYYQLARHEEAIERFHRAVELHPSSAIDYANLGVNYRKIGKNEEAVKFLALALSLDSELDFAASQLAELQAGA